MTKKKKRKKKTHKRKDTHKRTGVAHKKVLLTASGVNVLDSDLWVLGKVLVDGRNKLHQLSERHVFQAFQFRGSKGDTYRRMSVVEWGGGTKKNLLSEQFVDGKMSFLGCARSKFQFLTHFSPLSAMEGWVEVESTTREPRKHNSNLWVFERGATVLKMGYVEQLSSEESSLEFTSHQLACPPSQLVSTVSELFDRL